MVYALTTLIKWGIVMPDDNRSQTESKQADLIFAAEKGDLNA